MGGMVYLRWRSGVLNKTSSHMWGSQYFTIFLLRDGCTLMYIASLMVLVRVCDSLPKMEKLSNFYFDDLRCWHGHKWGKVLADSPIYSSHFYLYITPLFCVMLSLSLGATIRFLMVLAPLTWTWMPTLPQMLLKHLLRPWYKVSPYGCFCGCFCCWWC